MSLTWGDFKRIWQLALPSVEVLLMLSGTLFQIGDALSADTAARTAADGHVALILPLKSLAYGKAAEAVKNGFLSARETSDAEGAFPIEIYPTDGSVPEILKAYQDASHNGAVLVVGPLTRDGVTGLVNSNLAGLSTLALNKAEPDSMPPSDFYFFGLWLEDEARQTAQLMWQETGHTVFVAALNSPLFSRATDAFVEEWIRLGGRIIGPQQFSSNLDELLHLRKIIASSGADALFLAAGEQDTCRSRPFFGKIQPVYGISLANSGLRGEHCIDLQDVRFLDMPWMIEPTGEIMDAHAGSEDSTPAAQRFFALGADSYRLAIALMQGTEEEIQGLSGLSGQISYADNTFSRTLTSAVFDHVGIPRIQVDTARPSPARGAPPEKHDERQQGEEYEKKVE